MLLRSSSPLTLAAQALYSSHFGPASPVELVSAPGRVNLVGEHIDYHNLPVLPIAIQRGIGVAFRVRNDQMISAISAARPSQPRTFSLGSLHSAEIPGGDWGNYLRAAASVAEKCVRLSRGIDAAIVSDLPVAAGLSSSSALLIAFTLALLMANGGDINRDQLMSFLPDGEQFVGTRGGGMDHAAILGSRQGQATHIRFHPLDISHVPIPPRWRFIVADSRHAAEKSSHLAAEYNRRRFAGTAALHALGFSSFREAVDGGVPSHLPIHLNPEQRDAFAHVTGEAGRVEEAVLTLRSADLERFGELLNESHRSLRERLRVSTPAADALVATAREAGAAGARITGAGFGGCVVAVCRENLADQICSALKLRFYSDLPSDAVQNHLFIAEPAQGVLGD